MKLITKIKLIKTHTPAISDLFQINNNHLHYLVICIVYDCGV